MVYPTKDISDFVVCIELVVRNYSFLTPSISFVQQNEDTQTNTTSDTYDAYPVTIESVVYKKGGNFYNNNEKITGDKVYVEYKQISGLKNTTKQAEINTKLKEQVIALYDKNYLGDSNTLFVDIHTKISVNFNTLSYVIYRRGEDIDGKHILESIILNTSPKS